MKTTMLIVLAALMALDASLKRCHAQTRAASPSLDVSSDQFLVVRGEALPAWIGHRWKDVNHVHRNGLLMRKTADYKVWCTAAQAKPPLPDSCLIIPVGWKAARTDWFTADGVPR
jgi:hypothetical protein